MTTNNQCQGQAKANNADIINVPTSKRICKQKYFFANSRTRKLVQIAGRKHIFVP